MTRQTSSGDQNNALDQKAKVIRLIRLSGVTLIVLAGCIHFNFGGLTDLFGLDPETQKVLAMALIFVGLLDIVLVPRILHLVNTK